MNIYEYLRLGWGWKNENVKLVKMDLTIQLQEIYKGKV